MDAMNDPPGPKHAPPAASTTAGTQPVTEQDPGELAPAGPLSLAPMTNGPSASLLARFRQEGERFFFQDGTLAFTDASDRLRAHTNNALVIRTLVALAQDRGWPSIKLSGTHPFRRDAWQRAMQAGVPASGYVPTPDERALAHGPNGPSAQQRDAAQADRAPAEHEQEKARDVIGRLLEHGAAPYRFDGLQRLSYYARLQTSHGERTLWGVDLERAIVESASRVKPGDTVIVRNLGSRPVAIRQQRRNAAGNVVGEHVVETHRNAWEIETSDHVRERRQAAESIRRAGVIQDEIARRHAGVAQAVALLHVARLALEARASADRYSARDRDRILHHLRAALADRIEANGHVPAVMLRERLDHTPRSRPTPERAHEAPSR